MPTSEAVRAGIFVVTLCVYFISLIDYSVSLQKNSETWTNFFVSLGLGLLVGLEATLALLK